MTSAQDAPQPQSRSKQIAQDVADAMISPGFEGIVEVASPLAAGAAEAVSSAVEAVSAESFEGGGGDFSGGGATGEWELPSISWPDMPDISLPELPDISLLDIGLDF
jgi:hypothetical protein